MLYSIKAAAMATGVSAGRLRTWERRYGIPRPDRSASGRRQFDDRDLHIVRRMGALIDSGVPASDAAEAVRDEEDVETPLPVTPERANPLVELFVEKAMAFDQGWVTRILRDSVFSSGWAPTMERVVFPALRQLTSEWGAARANMAHVRFAHELMRVEASAELVKQGPTAMDCPSVVLACAEDDQYDIAALSFSLLLRLLEINVYYLGRSIPTSDLIAAAQQLEPESICLIGTRRASPGGLNRAARAIVSSKVPVQLYIGGSVLTRRDAPEVPGVHLPQSLTAAAERVASALIRD